MMKAESKPNKHDADMKNEYDLSKMKSRKNPYAKKLKKLKKN